MNPRTLFGERVRHLREQRGLTQQDLAHLSGLHRTYIGSVERGERNISLLNIHLLAAALGVEPAELFRYSEVSSGPSSPGSGDRRPGAVPPGQMP